MTSTQEPSLSTNKNTTIEQKNHPIATVVARLKEAGLDIQRFIQLQSGSKAPVSHTQHRPQAIDDTYGVYAGDGLIFVDLDDYKQEVQKPSGFADLPATFTVRTPHGGTHLYYVAKDEVKNRQQQWGEIRAENEYVVGPGSQLQDCSKDYHDCSQPTKGQYEISKDKPIRSIDRATLVSLFNTSPNSQTQERTLPEEDAEIDQELVEIGKESLEDLQEESNKAANDLISRLQGDCGDIDIPIKDCGKIDRSSTDHILLSLLYGTIQRSQDVDQTKAIRIADHTYREYCRKHESTADNQERRWTTDTEQYRNKIKTYVLNTFDPLKFNRFCCRTCDTYDWTDEPGSVSYNIVYLSVELLSAVSKHHQLPKKYVIQRANDCDLYIDDQDGLLSFVNSVSTDNLKINYFYEDHYTLRLPCRQDIVEAASFIDPDLDSEYIRKILTRLQQDEMIKMAKLYRSDKYQYVYYPAFMSRNPFAKEVRIGGDEFHPDNQVLLDNK